MIKELTQKDIDNWKPKESFFIEDLKQLRTAKTYTETSPEEDIQSKQHREIFFKHFNKEDIDLDFMLKNGKNAVNIVEKFNVFLREMRILFKFDISEMLVFLDDEGFKTERTCKLLSVENTNQIKRELMKKCRVKSKLDDDADFIF